MADFKPQSDDSCMITGPCYRFTLISKRVLRMEYDPEGLFEDRPTQVILNRVIDPPAFTVYETDGSLEIETEAFSVYYIKGPFSANHLYIDAHNNYTNYGARWRFGQTMYGDPPRHHNLFGTARTLDKLDGACELDFGLIDQSGHSLLDDSESMILGQDGNMLPRRPGVIDLYYFACGHEYAQTLADFYRLTGAPPLLPRWALGNWWSRYHPYTSETYQALLSRFEKEKLPFTVAVLDMDWHITRIPPRYGKGWTGYTWNRAYFPDPKGFLSSLHLQGYHCALNLHPADGVQPTEEQYPAIAKKMRVVPQTKRPIAFNCTDPQFMRLYFEELLHPLMDDGADFFWIDWQQGRISQQAGLDPLWILNHMHYLDSQQRRGRGLILSRYAGFGSHRYAVGFSGDTVASWASLRFQPYFTATAANAGYSWWSHDIGGFKDGVRDRELYIRWLQFGVFSPIMRMHCTNNPFCSKEPWSYDRETAQIAGEYLRLRHRLIPYWYTMNYLGSRDLRASIYPVYHAYPGEDDAYTVPNQYFFGSEMMVCPIVEKCDPRTNLAYVKAWIPQGLWTDFLTGKTYQGPGEAILCRSLRNQAVLAKPGAIIPLDGRKPMGNSTANPDRIDLHVFPGASNQFELYEDAGDGGDYQTGVYAITQIAWKWADGAGQLRIYAQGELTLLPPKRTYRIYLRGMEVGGFESSLPCAMAYDEELRATILQCDLASADALTLSLSGLRLAKSKPLKNQVFDFLNGAQLELELKRSIYRLYKAELPWSNILAGLNALDLEKPLLNALLELSL